VLADNDGQAAAETSAVYGSKDACAQAVEIRTGKVMNAIKGGLRLEIPFKGRYGSGNTTFVCSPYGDE
jgi:hypothetical protein